MRNSLLVLLLTWTPYATAAPSLEQILARMDEAGQRLKGMTATLEQKKWTEILGEYDAGERGTFSFLREGDKVMLRKDIQSPTVNSLVIRDGLVTFYQPSLKQAQEYRLGQHGDKAEFLLLGFGSNREALKEAYAIAYLGEEKLGDLVTHKLELKPKSEKVAAFFTRILLWVDPARWIPVRQLLEEPTGDHLRIDFSEIQINPKLSRSNFDIKLPREVRVIRN